MASHNRTQLLRIIKKSLNKQCRNHSVNSANTKRNVKQFQTKHFEEIQIPVPWGHISGKWYGPNNERPLVGLHGWLDNAGTFDTLAPYLPKNMPFLALDMPGHGLSSWMPQGVMYHFLDYIVLIRRVMEEFKWKKISLMGHSMSSITSFVFKGLLTDKIDMLIALDNLKPLAFSANEIIDHYGERIEKHLKIERAMREKAEMPCYEWDELVERMHVSTNKSVDMVTCKFLLQRNIKSSELEPHKYYFSRDDRLKAALMYTVPNDVSMEIAKRIKCPHLFIKALQGENDDKKYFDEVLTVLRQNPKFEYHEVEGSHHVHLNEPEKISKIINPFLEKWK